MPQSFTLIDDGHSTELQATIADGRVLLSDEVVRTTLGWELKPEGLCRGDVCVPVQNWGALAQDAGLDLVELARVLDRPLAIDVSERAAALAEPAVDRSAALHSLMAPDFTLPDLEGTMHTLSEHRGKKVLLIAYASW